MRTRREVGLDEEVEGEEEEAENEEEGAPGKAAAGKLGYRVDESSGDDAQTGFAAAEVERADRDVAGEIATQCGELVVDPEIEFSAMAPERKCTNSENSVTETGKKTESRTRTPMHETSPRLGGKRQASS
jgi:hypothetical protein